MSSWDIKPAEVKTILTTVQDESDTLGKALTEEKFTAIGEGISWGGGLTMDVSAAVGTVMEEQGENLTLIQNHISAGMAGVSNATIAYNNGQYDMAATFQSEMVKAADSGDFTYFVDHGYGE
ncbi:DUF6507 family protein [Micropruina sonneratiae]|uniref:DUF6507 family protein n=1 Tax=Micropruina sonneratiae TaxID=2986940 RepID=UPI00222805BB|nr:DUF6507 family protein [Micropruina sp. KQZ13P-5]MCW3156895.1 DUF6507 family protein [Micropruina sp. KQZ13P-5]